jgi:hypothetical protein
VGYKLGKREAVERPRDFRLADYAPVSQLPKAPKRFGFGKLYTRWGMLGNDRAGDCVFAGGAHETMIWTKVRQGTPTPFRTEDVLADYGAVTGYNPATGENDNGTYVHEANSYRRRVGLLDANGVRHKIAAYVRIDPKDWDALVRASYTFGAVGIGFEVPSTIWGQMGEEWDLTDEGAEIEGGHYVPVVGSMDSSREVTCVTWGKRQEMTRDFYERYNDEAWAMVSPDLIRGDGLGIHGFDLDRLLADLASLG